MLSACLKKTAAVGGGGVLFCSLHERVGGHDAILSPGAASLCPSPLTWVEEAEVGGTSCAVSCAYGRWNGKQSWKGRRDRTRAFYQRTEWPCKLGTTHAGLKPTVCMNADVHCSTHLHSCK